MDLAAKRGYRPGSVGRALSRNETRTVGLIVPNILNPFFGIGSRHGGCGARSRTSVIFGNSDEDAGIEDEYLSVLVEHSVDGLLIAPTRNRIRTIAALHRRGLPIVFLDRSLAGLDIPTVSIDFHTATAQLVCHLVATGRRFIGIIAGPTRVAMAPLRAAVVMEAAAAAGIAVPKRNVPIDDFTVEGGAPAFHELHKRGLPLTIVSLNNRMAEGVLEMMLMLGVTMGDDVSLASFDDIAFFRLVRPSITAVVQPIAQMAAVAFDFLIRRMGGERAESVLLEAGLAIPASTLGRSGTTPTP